MQFVEYICQENGYNMLEVFWFTQPGKLFCKGKTKKHETGIIMNTN